MPVWTPMNFKSLGVFLLFIFILPSFALAYDPPVGIPDPADSWGGTQDPIDDSAPARPDPWTSDQAGYYYIDSSGTDSGRTYGNPTAPRLTIPTTLSAGSYVEIAGDDFGTYSPDITCNGTSAAFSANSAGPVWIVGIDGSEPTFQDFEAQGTYFYVEEINIDTTGGFVFGAQSTRGVFRNSTIDGPGTEVTSNGAGIGFDGADADNQNTYLLVYGCTVRDLGLWTSDHAADFHGMKPRYFSNHVWILENTVYHVQGDSVQTGEASGTTFPEYIYIGRNTMYENKENCIDIKDGSDIIMSENICYGMDTAHGDDAGEGIVIHEESEWNWAINNTIRDCTVGLICSIGSNIYFVGNEIYDIDGSTDPASYYGGGVAIHMRSTTTAAAVVNNTIHNSDKGIQFATGNTLVDVSNNLISDRSDASAYDIMVQTTSTADVDYILHDSGLRVYWGGTTYTSASAFNSATSECANCPTEGDPTFTNEAGDDFSLQSGSQAIDVGEANSVFTTFSSRYSMSIAQDIDGTSRPQDSVWDIGAYEYTVGPSGSVAFSAGGGSVGFSAGGGSVGFE